MFILHLTHWQLFLSLIQQSAWDARVTYNTFTQREREKRKPTPVDTRDTSSSSFLPPLWWIRHTFGTCVPRDAMSFLLPYHFFYFFYFFSFSFYLYIFSLSLSLACHNLSCARKTEPTPDTKLDREAICLDRRLFFSLSPDVQWMRFHCTTCYNKKEGEGEE